MIMICRCGIASAWPRISPQWPNLQTSGFNDSSSSFTETRQQALDGCCTFNTAKLKAVYLLFTQLKKRQTS
jgi:hypothetical protein